MASELMDPSFEARSQHNDCQPSRAFVPFSRQDLEGSIPARFEKIARRFPDRLAIKDGDLSLTYDQLNRAANRIAHAIRAERGDLSEPIALLFERSIDMIPAILGVLKAGKSYVALDVTQPRIRTNAILDDCQSELILSNRRTCVNTAQFCDSVRTAIDIDQIPANTVDDNVNATITPATLASIVYTSGTTGLPKGVMDTHGNTLESARLLAERIHLAVADRLSLLHHLNAASARTNLYLALLNGASLLPLDVRTANPDDFVDWLHREKITILYCPVAFLRHLAMTRPDGVGAPDLRVLHISGAPITRSDFELYRKYFHDGVSLEISMGSTEARSIAAAVVNKQFVFPTEGSPIGYPPPGKSILILDDGHRALPEGEIGEIAVQGKNLNPGYWRQPALTAERYFSAFDGGDEPIYLTGDLGMKLPDGSFVHIGRKDLMVKIRGYRVTLTEIEAALLEHAQVSEAAVAAWDGNTEEKYLAAYVVARQDTLLSVSELNRFLRDRLPEYMMPSAFVFLPALPLTNGKVNRCALPVPSRNRPYLSGVRLAPRTDIERKLTNIWCEVLSLEEIGVNDNFFDLGGHSLLASQVISRVIRTFQRILPIKALFQSPTVAEMAAIIEQSDTPRVTDSDLVDLLRKIETMSNQEVLDRLARENRQ